MREVDFLTKAVNLAKQATEADAAGRNEEAYRLYDTAIEYFLTAIKYEKNDKMKESMRKKVTEYLERAEQLKKQLENPMPKKIPSKASNDGKEDGSDEEARSFKQPYLLPFFKKNQMSNGMMLLDWNLPRRP